MNVIHRIVELLRRPLGWTLPAREARRCDNEDTSWPSWAHWLTLGTLAAGGLGITVLFYRITYDDVFLAFRYAKNILSGHGLVYNPGERFLGTPAPLFVSMLVVGKLAVPWLSIHEIGGVLSGLALLGCGFFVYLLGEEYHQPLAGAFAGLLTVFSPFVVRTLGGETPIYLMLVCGAFYSYAREQCSLAAFLLGLAMLNRSEGIIAVGLLLGHYLLTQRRLPVRPVLVLGLTLAPWVLYATLEFGSPVTRSLEAKLVQRHIGLSAFIPSAAHWMRHVTFANNPWAVAFAPLAILGGIVAVRQWYRWSAFFGWIVAQSLAYLVLDVPFYHWYTAHLGVGLAVATGLGLWWAKEMLWSADLGVRGKGVSDQRKLAHLLLKGAGVLVLVSLACTTVTFSAWSAKQYHRGEPNPANRLYAKAGKWLRENTPSESSVAYIEIGQIGYYSERRIVDLLGLVTPGVADRLKEGNFLWAYQFYEPDYVLYNPLFGPWMHPVLGQSWFKAAYDVIGEIEQVGYPFALTVYRHTKGVELPAPVEVDVAQLEFDKPASLLSDARLGQTFQVSSPNLCGVEVLFATYGKENRRPVQFHLDSGSGADQVLVSSEIPAASVKDNTWFGAFFPPLADSADQPYHFRLVLPADSGSGRLALWTSSGDVYPGGTATGNGQPIIGDLAFKAYVCPDLGAR